MKCETESCDREATVHLTEIKDGVKHEMHFCEQCAAEKGLPGKGSHFSISELLAHIAGQTSKAAATPAPKTRRGKEQACPGCGTTIAQFQSSGRFGCPECYTTFRDDVQGLVEKIHDSSQHSGKSPQRISSDIALQKDLRQLQLELKRAVKREDYEKAAAIRDQIKHVEERLKAAAEGVRKADAPTVAAPAGSARRKSADAGDKEKKKGAAE